jgi:hypothetical protein
VTLQLRTTYVVIPAKAGFSTAELVIHFCVWSKVKMDSRFRANDGNLETFAT